jgi:hypothetical protein
MAKTETLGAKIGPRVARLAADAVIYARTRHAPMARQVALGVANDFFDQVGNELRDQHAAFTETLAAAPDMPRWAARLLGFAAHGHGQASALLSFALYGTGFANSLTGLLTNELNPAMTRWIAQNPNAILSPNTAAALRARGLWDEGDAAYEAARGGYDRQRFDLMTAASLSAPGLGETLTARNRGLFDDGEARAALVDSGVSGRYHDVVLALRHQVLSPADAALMVVKGIIDDATGRHVAGLSGLSGEDFERLTLATGEPLALQELLLLYRRGVIDDAKLTHGIRQSRVRNEWIDEAKELRYMPPGAGEVIAASVQSHLTPEDARRRLSEAGIDPANYEWLYETAGRPPGVEMMLRLLNRRIIGEDVVRQAIRESDVKNKYVDAILASRVYLPPVRSIPHLYSSGAVTRDVAYQMLLDDGVTPEDANAYLAAASGDKVAGHKDLSVSILTKLYEDRILSRADALAAIEGHGYDATEAGYILEVADLSRANRILDAAVSRVHNLFVGHKIDAVDAQGTLGRLGVQGEQVGDLLRVWTLERDANVRVLTPAQIVTAALHQIIPVDEAQAELEHLGYETRDAQIVLALRGLGPLAPAPAGG